MLFKKLVDVGKAEKRVPAFIWCVSEDSLREVTSKQPRRRRIRKEMFQKVGDCSEQ